MRALIFISLVLCSQNTQAHQADLSTTMLMEQADGTWLIQITASLTAFQHEVRAYYPEYTSSEEFQEYVIDHLKKNLLVCINQQDTLDLEHVFTQLGHETKVVFAAARVPADIQTIQVSNPSFEDIHSNQSALVLAKRGFASKQVVLSAKNDHTARLGVKGAPFISLPNETSTYSSLVYLILGILAVASCAIIYIGIENYFLQRSVQENAASPIYPARRSNDVFRARS